ncbi:MAG: hypothetical protein ACLRVQ_06140 [Lachnospiraceae bacterium]
MKKRVLALTLGMMMTAFALTGCSSDADNKSGENNTKESENTSVNETSGYVFTYNDIKIGVDMDFAPILEKLGEPLSYFEAESCAAQGIGKTYTYSDFVIDTYPDGDRDLILCITLKTDNVATEEGIDLSMTKDDVTAKYGEPTEETDIAIGYKKDGMRINFIFEGDTMISIQYDSSLNL